MLTFLDNTIDVTWGELIICMFAGIGVLMTVMTLISIIKDFLRRRRVSKASDAMWNLMNIDNPKARKGKRRG